ncbi:uncharacterized protein LOC119740580 [Patiria miniata]|uniref:DUF6729 domain-containing protein n=1 Tax=Patiria miniata TaxID=46514 RepID=A0A914B6V4_PATMI|nr:uncharacterized protein LOC119740580 [Patiria miniata]
MASGNPDKLLPKFRINDSSVRPDRQQCVLKCTRAAVEYQRKKRDPTPSAADSILWDERTALVGARRRANARGVPNPTEQQYLGQLVITFGKYTHCTFQWLLENDVGYVKYLVDKHIKETHNRAREVPIRDGWVKDLLWRYAESFRQVSTHLEKNIDECVYPVPAFRSRTFSEMWDMYNMYRTVYQNDPQAASQDTVQLCKKAYCSVRYWLEISVKAISSQQLKRFRQYISDKDAKVTTATPNTKDECSTSSIPLKKRKMASESESSPSPVASTSRAPQMASSPRPSPVASTSRALPMASSPRPSPVASTSRALPMASSPRPSAVASTSRAPPMASSPRPSTVASTSRALPMASSPRPSTVASTSRAPPMASSHRSSPVASPEVQEIQVQASEISYEGWCKSWEIDGSGGIPATDRKWLKCDSERGMFGPIQVYKDVKGEYRRRHVLKSDRMWFHPPECPGLAQGSIPAPEHFFHARVFFWRPLGVWQYSIRCPRLNCPGREDSNIFLYRSGYHSKVRQICDISGWYSMLTEVLSCGPCNKAASKSGDKRVKWGRFLAWDMDIIKQLSEAHQAFFPAVLTARRGVDKNVVQLLRDRTEGNTMSKVWRQIQENHCEDYLNRKDMYTTLLYTLAKPGGIVSALGHQFKRPPERHELPSPRLLRHAFLLEEANHVQDYRTQVLSIFGRVLKFDSTKKYACFLLFRQICKKLSGASRGTAEWFTSVGNEKNQIVTFVLTCEESTDKLTPMAEGLMTRYEKAGQPPPEVMYVDRGCCRGHGATAVETLFHTWVDSGMVIRLDAWHWMHRFHCAVRTDSHPKYALFKSALSGAVFAYNRQDLDLLIQAVRDGSPAKYSSLSDEEVVHFHITHDVMKHYVRRITLGVQEGFRRVSDTIEALKGDAGLDENGISLFKSPEAIDEVWAAQQKHLECLQDPPEMSMYSVAKLAVKNGVQLPYYACVRGNNSLEGFHVHLPKMIPGPHCDPRPFQVYLLSGIARWNADREASAVFGRKGRKHRIYSGPLINRLNTRCRALFGEEEIEEENFRIPAESNDELLGLEYLFMQSTGSTDEMHITSSTALRDEGPTEEEEVMTNEESDEGLDDGYNSEADLTQGTAVTPVHMVVTTNETAEALDPACEDVCGMNPLPGFAKVEKLSQLLTNIATDEGKLALSAETRRLVIEAWNQLDEHDKSPQKFQSRYKTHWGNTLYGRTKGDPEDAAITQRVKFRNRYTPAQVIDVKRNRLMYCVVKHIWLRAGGVASPEKCKITKLYERMQQRVMVEDPILSKLGIPLPKVNTKCVREFLRRQEALASTNATSHGNTIIRRWQSVSGAKLPDAPEMPQKRGQTDWPETTYADIPSMAGTKVVKARHDVVEILSTPLPSLGISSSPVSGAAGSHFMTGSLPPQFSSHGPSPVAPRALFTTTGTSPPRVVTSAGPSSGAAGSDLSLGARPLSSVYTGRSPGASRAQFNLAGTLTRPATCSSPFVSSAGRHSGVLVSDSSTTSSKLSLPSVAAGPSSGLSTDPSTSSSQVVASADSSPTWARSTTYSRAQKERRSNKLMPKKTRKESNPTCILCGKPMQGHKKYRKKSFCEDTKRSTSAGFQNREFIHFEHFKIVVDEMLG